MIKYLKLTTFIIILVLLFASCNKKTKLDNESFLIYIDSIKLPNNIPVNTSFDIFFYGIVGTDGCSKFYCFKTEKSNNEILIEALGKKEIKDGICPSVMIYLNEEKLNFLIEETGDYLIKIKQPDNSYFEKQISVE